MIWILVEKPDGAYRPTGRAYVEGYPNKRVVAKHILMAEDRENTWALGVESIDFPMSELIGSNLVCENDTNSLKSDL